MLPRKEPPLLEPQRNRKRLQQPLSKLMAAALERADSRAVRGERRRERVRWGEEGVQGEGGDVEALLSFRPPNTAISSLQEVESGRGGMAHLQVGRRLRRVELLLGNLGVAEVVEVLAPLLLGFRLVVEQVLCGTGASGR